MSAQKRKKKCEVPATYESSLTWRKKCLYILNEGGAMSVGDILKRLVEFEPNIRVERARNNIQCSLNYFIENEIVKEVEARNFNLAAIQGRKVVIVQNVLRGSVTVPETP